MLLIHLKKKLWNHKFHEIKHLHFNIW
jgi:hypothetical protein